MAAIQFAALERSALRAIIDRLNRAATTSMESGALRERQDAGFGCLDREAAVMRKQDFHR